MTLRTTAIGLALLLATPLVGSAEEKRTAQPRSGSSSSSRSGSSVRGGGAQHRSPSSSVSSSSRRSRPSRGTSANTVRSTGRNSTVRPTTGAQRRHPRAGTGRLYRSSRYYGSRPYRYLGRSYYGGYWPSSYFGYYSRPWYFGPGFRTSFGYGDPYLYGYSYYPYYGGYGYGYGYGGGHGTYVTPRDTETVGARLMIDPQDARVYVDGSYAGEVDDFDGMFQRLYLEPGEHELGFELEGYRSYVLILDVAPGASLKIRHSMEEGSGKPVVDDRTGGRALASREVRDAAQRSAPVEREPSERDERYERREEARPTQLRLDVSPKDASVYVDGEFRGTAGLLTDRPLALGPGTHRIEIVRPGLQAVSREVSLESGESEEISVVLEP